MQRAYLGGTFLLLGALVAAAVLFAVYQTITGQLQPPLLQTFNPNDPANRTVVFPGGQVQMPPILVGGAGYGVLVLLLGIASHVANGLLSAGARILAPDADLIIKQLRRLAPEDRNRIER